MLNLDQNLNPKIFDEDVEVFSMRNGFGNGIVEAAMHDKNIIGLCADLTDSTDMSEFKRRFPDRFIEVGVAEQNLATVSSGLARMGKIPFMTSYAIFSPGRNWEQIRTTICYNNVPVKIVSSHIGVSVGPDGGSHQALEDIALMRVLPRMTVISPCDAIEAKKAVMAAAKTNDPTYIRLSRDKTPIMTTEHTPFHIGKAQVYYLQGQSSKVKTQSYIKSSLSDHNQKKSEDSLDVTIVATGYLLHRALKVAKRLEGEGKNVAVVNLSTIKPLDEDALIKLAHQSRAFVTVEEHQAIGGMGSAVAECLAKHFPIPVEFVAVQNIFGQSGKADELIEHYGLEEKDIYAAVKRVLLRK
jgi:transketolase